MRIYTRGIRPHRAGRPVSDSKGGIYLKTMARYLIYVAAMAAATALLAQPFRQWLDSGELDAAGLLVHVVLAFSLVFAGTEASERLRKRWGP